MLMQQIVASILVGLHLFTMNCKQIGDACLQEDRNFTDYQLVASRRGYVSLRKYLTLQAGNVNDNASIESFLVAFISL
jgi:hypothetical protein